MLYLMQDLRGLPGKYPLMTRFFTNLPNILHVFQKYRVGLHTDFIF